ncbi:hypothetical protein [Vulcanisaeta sp. JCM 14467]
MRMSIVRNEDEWDRVVEVLINSRANDVKIYLERSSGDPEISITIKSSIRFRVSGRERRRIRREVDVSIHGREAYLQGIMPRIIDYISEHELDHELITINAKAGAIRDYLPTPRIGGTTLEEAASGIKELVRSIGSDLVIIHLFDEYPDWVSITDMDYLFTDGQVRLREDFNASIYGGYGRRYNAEYSVTLYGTWLISTDFSNKKEGFHVVVYMPRRNWGAVINLLRDAAPGNRLYFVNEDEDCILPVLTGDVDYEFYE